MTSISFTSATFGRPSPVMNCIKNAYQESHMCDGRNVANVNNNDVSDGNKEPCEAVNAIQLKI